MPEKGIRSIYSQSPFQILMCDDVGTISTGSAFFYQHAEDWFLITNWHNFSGKHFLTKAPISPSPDNGGPGIRSYYVTGPNKIYYTDDQSYRNGPCLVDEGDRWTVQLHDLGMVKNSYWAFEDEWRYKILATFSEGILNEPRPASHPALDLTSFPVRENAVFAPLDPQCLQSIEVLLGPCVTAGQEVVVKALLSTYAPEATLKKSEIQVRLKG